MSRFSTTQSKQFFRCHRSSYILKSVQEDKLFHKKDEDERFYKVGWNCFFFCCLMIRFGLFVCEFITVCVCLYLILFSISRWEHRVQLTWNTKSRRTNIMWCMLELIVVTVWICLRLLYRMILLNWYEHCSWASSLIINIWFTFD